MKRLALAFAWATVACGPTPESTGIDGGNTGESCVDPGQRRCSGQTYQECRDGFWWELDSCAAPEICTASVGCAECNPQFDRTCVGDNVFTCNDDGTIGPQVESCGLEQCANGVCGSDICETEGVKLIYVVDVDYNLLSFDPGNGNVFSLIGRLSCPAGPSWPDWGGLGAATPFSMSVDRDARAWVLYTSGEIFWVSTQDASCQPSGFVKGQQGYELFGMGFVADAPGSNSEKLFVAGGGAGSQTSGRLGFVDPATLVLTDRAPIPAAEYSPELTGTGNAELYGYYPGMNTFVARMNQTSAQSEQTWSLPPLAYTVVAWAFAHWGGRFYIFVTTEDLFSGAQTREVYLLDPMTGNASLLLADIPYIIVGAGVSTCAPVIVE